MTLSPSLAAEYERIVRYMRDIRIPSIIESIHKSEGQKRRFARERAERTGRYADKEKPCH